jgi:hypothetical protein
MAGAADDELERRLVGDESGTMNFRNGSTAAVGCCDEQTLGD